ncbi:DUF1622 domain-containing protein [Falsiroseomonas selenitidurans]|uniref:DUF1622 domain-containing protein n=1 Tax=Falsiroseomonas selenitidurans TaxID=2716335 RepID=A0ABX1E7E7_9PROT|nr:DUF1622 domain-containing protein [Falsiroseomonas selenitidurans]NKC32856.1 DUF1622 domain-containing protein [Falsiroseomonas selenitidurans]
MTEDFPAAWVVQFAGWVAAGLEAVGVLALLGGVVLTTASFLRAGLGADRAGSFRRYRAQLGQAILLGLELLVAADIVHTIATPLTFESIATLGLVVLIRTVLSLSLEVEIHGRWPWRRADHGQ